MRVCRVGTPPARKYMKECESVYASAGEVCSTCTWVHAPRARSSPPHLVPFIPPSKLTCEVLRGNSVNLGMAPADPDKALNALRRLAANKRCGSCPYEERMGFKDV